MLLSPQRVQQDDPFLYHKTTRRDLYNAERARCPQVDEVLFCNEAGEVTEGSIYNLVLRRGGRLLTPALSCGLLPGTLRGELLERGILSEAVITVEDLLSAEGLWLINSVRGWRRAVLVGYEALTEYVQRRKQAEIINLFHKVEYDSDYDYKDQRKKR